MKNRLFIFIALFFCFSMAAAETGSLFGKNYQGDFEKPGFGVGLNYLGIGLKAGVSSKIVLEAKYQLDRDITVMGLRGYYYFNTDSRVQWFMGFEGDTISFKGEDSKGTGLLGELLIGTEILITKYTSVQLDLGPAMISLNDSATSLSVSGMEYIANIGVNLYY
ncbi:MAG: hypothetical protein A2297_00775 [Elusimicrobia bacterium RIFOXYB2_FULL_48_7]|nr:MAG: hypothetical protein A2297_00775 [Elusimicrobia bacterium RIFOXYB2_FULL_48_7]